jgi:hypothetical protein
MRRARLAWVAWTAIMPSAACTERAHDGPRPQPSAAVRAAGSVGPSSSSAVASVTSAASASVAPGPSAAPSCTTSATPDAKPGPLGAIQAEPKAATEALVRRLCAERGVPEKLVPDMVRVFPSGVTGADDADKEILEHAPFVPLYQHQLYRADIDNDGSVEWVVTNLVPTGGHASGIELVLQEACGKLRELPFYETFSHDLLDGKDFGQAGPANLDTPFLVRAPEGIEFRLRDIAPLNADGEGARPDEPYARILDIRYAYRWQGGAIRLLRREDKSHAVKP